MDETDAQASGVWPELEALALLARERRRLPPDTRSRIILQLCERLPLSVKELSILLDRSEAYIGDAIRPLVTGGDLTFLYPDQPRHPKQKYLSAKATLRKYAPPQAVRMEPAKASNGHSRYQPSPESLAPATEPRKLEPVPLAAAEPEALNVSEYPNQAINLLIVLYMGVALATRGVLLWPVFAVVTGLGLAIMHVAANSTQYARYCGLKGPSRKGSLVFMALKTGVVFVEIAIVYFAANAITDL